MYNQSEIYGVIATEKDFNQCLNQLNTTPNITHCTLKFTYKNLSEAQIIALSKALAKQVHLQSLSITVDISIETSDKMATILGNTLTSKDFVNLESLTLRGANNLLSFSF
jgi:galactitol-specific phosphotransferase system IIB component